MVGEFEVVVLLAVAGAAPDPVGKVEAVVPGAVAGVVAGIDVAVGVTEELVGVVADPVVFVLVDELL